MALQQMAASTPFLFYTSHLAVVSILVCSPLLPVWSHCASEAGIYIQDSLSCAAASVCQPLQRRVSSLFL